MTLAEIAESRDHDPLDCAIDVMLDGSTRVASFNINLDDVEAFMQREWVMTSSDGTDGHPRKYASFPKRYRNFVVDRSTIAIEKFLYQSSGLTAETFGLTDRGRIESPSRHHQYPVGKSEADSRKILLLNAATFRGDYLSPSQIDSFLL